ncbi:hypothetical protein N3K66_004669 [Trichothecium roseum]|uniref:Uncharacterized protein n=1 Tax=Trichothecium roseum TaxID=47278 RepID=A0ACC0V289_9HYPO|nr:hypothetical protein N3K66_004669 [Trichothecium roseum]
MATSDPTLSDRFAGLPQEEHPSAWKSCWETSCHPWTRPGPSLALSDLLLQRPDLVPPSQEVDGRGNPIRGTDGAVVKRTALVPGCGLGRDVLLLSRLGYDVVGLDVSESACEAARENEKRQNEEEDWPIEGLDKDAERGSTRFLAADFFDEAWSEGLGTDGSGKFDLIFDYTFLCALPPSRRPQWAARIASLLAPHGRLVCLEFPSGKAPSEGGPPWGVSPELYEALLAAPGDEVAYGDGGLHRLSLLKPPRTHRAGTDDDGSVRDFVSVWCR